MLMRVLDKLRLTGSIDVHDIHAFYIREVKRVELSKGVFAVYVRMADSTPSRGRGRYDDRNYDYTERVSYAGQTQFDQSTMEMITERLYQKHHSAHDD